MEIDGEVDELLVLNSFAQAELSSPRHRDRVLAWADPDYRARLLSKADGSWTGDEQRAARAALLGYRGPVLKELLALRPRWHNARCSAVELGNLRTIAFYPFESIAPDRRVETLVAAMDAGRETPRDEFSAGYRELRRAFDPRKTRGIPSAVATTQSGPFVLFEGLTRLSVVHSLRVHGQPVPDPIALYVGISDELARWRFYGRL